MRRAALFIDFDNFFTGLLGADPVAAMRAVENPGPWLKALARGDDPEDARRWLILRCYLNPGGWVDDPRDRSKRLYHSTFRPFFTQAGIEVVDCPSLTRAAKNGADIRITVDVMTALQAKTRFDEIVIASSDADFTPLLQVVRANDRRITVIATSTTARAYASLADDVLDESDLFALAQGRPVGDEHERPVEPAATPVVHEVAEPEVPEAHLAPELDPAEAQRRFEELVRERYASATEPLNLAAVSTQLVAELGPAATKSQWFGSGGFVAALRRLQLPGAEFGQHHVWDSTRHEKPVATAVAQGPSHLPPTIARIASVTDMPKITSDLWPVVYSTLEAYLVTHEFDFTEATKWARDQAVAEGHEIARQPFGYVVRACRYAGTPLTDEPSPDATTIGQAVLRSVLKQAELAGLIVDEKDRGRLAEWLHVPIDDEPDASRVDVASV